MTTVYMIAAVSGNRLSRPLNVRMLAVMYKAIKSSKTALFFTFLKTYALVAPRKLIRHPVYAPSKIYWTMSKTLSRICKSRMSLRFFCQKLISRHNDEQRANICARAMFIYFPKRRWRRLYSSKIASRSDFESMSGKYLSRNRNSE